MKLARNGVRVINRARLRSSLRHQCKYNSANRSNNCNREVDQHRGPPEELPTRGEGQAGKPPESTNPRGP